MMQHVAYSGSNRARDPWAFCRRLAVLAIGASLPWVAAATESGFPLARTGAFQEKTCQDMGCHSSTSGSASVAIEVGPYVPGATQPVVVTVFDSGASSWGFQLAARRASNPGLPAGTMEAINQFVAVRCASGGRPPCGPNELEYATHTSVGTNAGSRSGSQKFSVNWTAPSGDVGDVIFTAAGLGANNDRSGLGDHTATGTAISLFAPSNRPMLNQGGTVNAADPANPVIAPGSLVTIFGAPLAAPDTFRVISQNDLDERGRIPTELNRLSVEFRNPDSPNIFRGRILFVGDKQVNLQAPDFPVVRNQDILVEVVLNPGRGPNEVRSNVITARTESISPALFTFDSSGRNDAAAVHAPGNPVGADGKFRNRFGASTPARPGEIVLVFGNGFGRTNPNFTAGEIPDQAAPLVSGATAEIGGRMLMGSGDIGYAGIAPFNAGLYQFNVRIPRDLPPGNHPIFIRSGGVSTQAGVFVAVGP